MTPGEGRFSAKMVKKQKKSKKIAKIFKKPFAK